MTSADEERLRSWAVEIASTLLPDLKSRDEGNERRFLGRGGFTVNRRTGAWYSHTASKGSYSPIRLIEFLAGYGTAEAVKWATAWLKKHPGTGKCAAEEGDEDGRVSASAADARDAIERMVEVLG